RSRFSCPSASELCFRAIGPAITLRCWSSPLSCWRSTHTSLLTRGRNTIESRGLGTGAGGQVRARRDRIDDAVRHTVQITPAVTAGHIQAGVDPPAPLAAVHYPDFALRSDEQCARDESRLRAGRTG